MYRKSKGRERGVNCRIGSLEMREFASPPPYVNCRIGSLESQEEEAIELLKVNCRKGSLEMQKQLTLKQADVNCRIGSLENLLIVFTSIKHVNHNQSEMCTYELYRMYIWRC